VQIARDVGPYELLKLRLLNGAHQAIAYFAALDGRDFIHEAAQDPLLRAFVAAYLREEAAPTLPPVPGVDLADYARTVIERFSNAEIRDTVARICAYTSDRIPKFVLPVVRERLADGAEVRLGAAIVASWARYAEGTDDHGEPIEVIDRLRDTLTARARRHEEDLESFIADRAVFGDLADDARFVSAYRDALLSLRERGARATLESLVAERA
jgi:mannitol 2-dehydrogenase